MSNMTGQVIYMDIIGEDIGSSHSLVGRNHFQADYHWFEPMRTFLMDVYNKRRDIHDEIMEVQGELNAARAYSDVAEALKMTMELWDRQLYYCEEIERSALRLDGALRLLMNLRITSDQGTFLDTWDTSLVPLFTLFAENVEKTIKEADAFNSRLQHNLKGMRTENEGHSQAFYRHDTSPKNGVTATRLQEDLPKASLQRLKTSLLDYIGLRFVSAPPRSQGRLPATPRVSQRLGLR